MKRREEAYDSLAIEEGHLSNLIEIWIKIQLFVFCFNAMITCRVDAATWDVEVVHESSTSQSQSPHNNKANDNDILFYCSNMFSIDIELLMICLDLDLNLINYYFSTPIDCIEP